MRIATGFIIVIAGLLSAAAPLHAGVDADNLNDYGKGIITDYSNMAEMDAIEYGWIKPGVKLSSYRYKIQPLQNLTVIVDEGMENVFKTVFPKQLERAGSRDANAPVLNVKGAIYWAERANSAKRWIPFGGASMAQAGVGIELVLTDASGQVVGKIRTSGRAGSELKAAALSVSDDVAKFVRAN